MNLRKAVLVLAAAVTALATLAAQAQVGVYGAVTVNQLSNIKSSPALPGPGDSAVRRDSVNPLGGIGGVYYDFLKLGPIKLGGDLRGSLSSTRQGAYVASNSQGARLYSTLGGVRAVFHTRFLPLRPYVQASAGLARSNYGLVTVTGQQGQPATFQASSTIVLHNNFQYMGYAGLDVTLLPYMDFRVVEFGYGGINPFGTYSHNYPVKSVSSGLVFHLPF